MIKGVNLIPDDIQAQWRFARWRHMLWAAGIVYATVFTAFFLIQVKGLLDKRTGLHSLEKEKAALIAANAQYSELSLKVETMRKTQSELQKRLGVASELSGKKVSWSVMLRRLSAGMPSKVWLRSLSTFDEEATGVKKIRFLGSAMTNRAVGDFAFFLENSGFAHDVALLYSQKREVDGIYVYDFEMTMGLIRTEELTNEW